MSDQGTSKGKGIKIEQGNATGSNTKDELNKRLVAFSFSNSMDKTVTPEMLAAHPTRGAYSMAPSCSRQDTKSYNEFGSYFPDAKQGFRPTLPPASLFQNPWLQNYDIQNGEIARELRGVVKENNRFLVEDSNARTFARTFETP
jgi:hypothetical protein